MADTGLPVRLYCFAHAGAGVSVFHGWARRTGPGVEPVPVLLPGRGGRRQEARLTGRDSLVAHLMDRISVTAGQPYALYGHSLGAMVAHTLTQALHEQGMPLPALLAVGACPPRTRPASSPTPARAPTTICWRCSTSWERCPTAPKRGGTGVVPRSLCSATTCAWPVRYASPPVHRRPRTGRYRFHCSQCPGTATRWCHLPRSPAGAGGVPGPSRPAPWPVTTSSCAVACCLA